MNVNNKTIAVIGAGGRLGSEIVNALIHSGANVLAIDVNDHALSELASTYRLTEQFIPMSGDITRVESVRSIIVNAEQNFGGFDGAVNSAYPRNSNYGREFFDVTYEDFCENLSIHLGGYFLFMQQCAKYAKQRNIPFSLVNMSSIYGVVAPRFNIYTDTDMTMPVEYAAIKSALQHLGTYATAYTKGTKFRVNCVSPGGILNGQDQNFLEKYNQYCRSKGMLDAQNITGAVLFLLSDSSQYICGQNIIVDDGFSI